MNTIQCSRVARLIVTAFICLTCLQAQAQLPPPGWGKPSIDSVNGALRTMDYSTQATLAGKSLRAVVSFYCNPKSVKDEHGTLGFSVFLLGAQKIKAFHFDDFEGPDAQAGGKKLMHVSINRAGKPPLAFSHPPSGITPTVPNFLFEVSEQSRVAKSVPKSILLALADQAESMQISIPDPRNPKVVLEISVPLAGMQPQFKALLVGLK